MPAVFPGSVGTELYLVPLLYLRGQQDSLSTLLAELRNSTSPQIRAEASMRRSALALVNGQLASAEKAYFEGSAIERARGGSALQLSDSLASIFLDVWFRDRKERGAQRLDAALQHLPLGIGSEQERPYFWVAELYARAGRPDRAKAILAQYDREVRDTALKRFQSPLAQRAQAEIALAERRPLEALALFRKSDTLPDGPVDECAACIYAPIARAFDEAGVPDSAILAFEHFLSLPALPLATEMHPTYLAGTYKRLGELYEQQGNAGKALEYYGKFVALWKNADPDLQPRVADVRRRIARLSDPERR
jgi:tetratricopeptide (TPR) repeat protein